MPPPPSSWKTFTGALKDPVKIETMRDRLRTFLQHHRGHKDEQWAMAETDLKPLDRVFAMLQPTGVE